MTQSTGVFSMAQLANLTMWGSRSIAKFVCNLYRVCMYRTMLDGVLNCKQTYNFGATCCNDIYRTIWNVCGLSFDFSNNKWSNAGSVKFPTFGCFLNSGVQRNHFRSPQKMTVLKWFGCVSPFSANCSLGLLQGKAPQLCNCCLVNPWIL